MGHLQAADTFVAGAEAAQVISPGHAEAQQIFIPRAQAAEVHDQDDGGS